MGTQSGLSSNTRQAVVDYFDAFNARDAGRMPLAADVYFKAPLRSKPLIGVAAVRSYLERAFETFDRIDIERLAVEEEFAFAMLDYCLPGTAPIKMVDCFRVIDGKIVEILPYYDHEFAPGLSW